MGMPCCFLARNTMLLFSKSNGYSIMKLIIYLILAQKRGKNEDYMDRCSHGHADHYGVECVQIINGTEDSPFSVKKMNTYHDDKYGQLRGKNQIIVIEDEKSKIVHLGDLGCELLPEQKEQLMNIEVLMIPVGGYYTIDGKQAAKIVQELNPKIVIPMHYRDDTKRYGFDVISTVDDFTEQIGDVINLPTSQLDSTIDYGAQVVLLQPLNAMVL